MDQVKNGDKVKVHYTAKLEDGRVFESTHENPPFDFVVGDKKIMPGLEQGVIGMEVGSKKTIEIPPGKAFGPRRPELVVEVCKSDLPSNITPTLGQRLKIQMPDDQTVFVTVTQLEDETVTLDANHPLAGEVLIYTVHLVSLE